MKHLFNLILEVVIIIFMLCRSVLGEVSKKEDNLKLVAVKVVKPPVIDGNLDDDCWLRAALFGSKASGFVTHDGKALASEQTLFYVAYDDVNLYLATVNFTERVDNLIANIKKRDGGVDADDENEIFINVDYLQVGEYFQFLFNPIGTKAEAKGGWKGLDFGWNPYWEVKTSVGKIIWAGEVSLPFKELGIPTPKEGDIWGFNVGAHNAADGEWAIWNPTFGGFHNPERFGYLSFGCNQRLFSKDFEEIVRVGRVLRQNIADLRDRIEEFHLNAPEEFKNGLKEVLNRVVEIDRVVKETETKKGIVSLESRLEEITVHFEEMKRNISKSIIIQLIEVKE